MSAKPCLGPEVEVEIIAYAPTEFFHCMHCEMVWGALESPDWHADQRQSALPPDLQAQYEDIGGWINDVRLRHGDRIRFDVIDAASIEGLVKSIRHRSRRFPVFVINGKERFAGEFNRDQLNGALERTLQAREVTPS